MRHTQIIISLVAYFMATLDFQVHAIPQLRSKPTVQLDPETIARIDEYMDVLKDYANKLEPRYDSVKQNVLKLQRNVRMLARMKSRSQMKLYSYICEEFDDFFKPDNPDYFIHSPNVGPALRNERQIARAQIRRVYGAIQSMWLTKIMHSQG
ncbi:hypothetical protein BgAZ_201720 [Babesia gibsoni]|uniref:Uncharacterized protein n=1 Tax=Babesia gibsoni TaxID=33632 RepID=A0AAD8PE61_BABGI|nr:hypothetical protein BgAZ_201720 [Babesia gibsoni]